MTPAPKLAPVRACACGAAITHPSPYATRCQDCDAHAQATYFRWLDTLPETRILDDFPERAK